MSNNLTVFAAKKIITMNPSQPEATHVAVRDGFILEVGDLDECAAWGAYTLDDRYADAVLIPGMIESHAHQSEGVMWTYHYVGAIDRYGPDGKLRRALRSIAAVIKDLQEFEPTLADPNEPLFAWNADPSFYATPAPITRQDLDQVSATRPILVVNASGHIAYANSKLLDMAGYAKNHAEGVMRDANGELTGELQELAAMYPAMMIAGKAMLGGQPDAAYFWNFGRVAALRGVTTVNDGGLGPYYDPAFYAAAVTATADPAFPVRIVAHHNGITVTTTDEILSHVASLADKGNDKLIFQAVKFVLDGSIQGFTARLRSPYYLRTGANGIWNRPPEEISALIGAIHAAGQQIACHCNGDQAAEAFVDAVAAAQATTPRFDHRHFIVHGQMIDEALLRRMAALGICATLFPNHIYYWGDFHYHQTVGPARSQGFSPLATALRLGVPVGVHSDTPVSPIDPLFSAWCAVNRVTSSGRVLGPAERISVYDALRLVTVGAAYLLHQDKEIGSIQVGKRADFAVLGADPLAVGGEHLKDVPVLGTVLGGQPVAF